MARGARGVTCRECGCLNFSSEHEVCDKCRAKTPTFRPTARRSSQSGTRDRASTSTNGFREVMAHSNGKKRRYEETKHTSNKKHEDKRVKAPPKKQPDVIDLISDDDEDDVVVHKVFPKRPETIKSRRQEDEDKTRLNEDKTGQNELFQGREFPTVTFSESDFPSMEKGAMMRKRAADESVKYSEPTVGTGTTAVPGKANSALSQPVSMPPSQNPSLQQGTKAAQGKTIDQKLKESRPPPAKEGKEVKTHTAKIPTQTSAEGNGSEEATRKNATATTAVRGAGNDAVQSEKDTVQAKQAGSSAEQEDPLFQSRVFDSVEFKAPDFVTVFEGMAAARRSHPPAPKTVSLLPPSNATEATTSKAIEAASSEITETTSSKVTEATSSKTTEAITSKATTAVTISASPSANERMGQVKTPTVAVNSSTKSAFPQTITKPTSEADPTSTTNTGTNSVNSAEASTLPTPTTVVAPPPAVQPSAPFSSANPPQTASNPTSTPASAARLPPTSSSSAPVQASPVSSTQVNSTSTTPPTLGDKMKAAAKAKPLTVPSTSPPVPAAVTLSSGVPSMRLPSPAPPVSRPAPVTAPKATTRPHSMTTITVGVTPVAAKVPSATSKNTVASKAGAANVLLPKKKHSEESQRSVPAQQPLSVVTDASDADAVLFVKVNAAPFGVTPVEPPVLGYCCPEFLAFMRECGDEDADEDDDPEEVSRSQLKLLNVVDLTNLSDSENSDAESPMPTPRASATSTTTQQGLLDNGKLKNLGLLPTAAETTAVSGNRTWYVPALDSERTRTRPEKVMCELCEETGLPSRLMRCPTCSKYYHKKCARENGDENICWNCELGSMIDDSELDQEHAKHNSEYLAYLRGIRRSASPDGGEDEEEDGEEDEEEQEEEDENNQEEGDEGENGDGDAEMPGPGEGKEDNNLFSEEGSAMSAGKRWKEFIGGATADVDDSFHEVTKRIAEELRDEEKKHIYSRGFVSRDEFEEQMAEVEEYYISEEARLQQLEREKALEGRKAAEARRAQAAEQAAQGATPDAEQSADSGVNANNLPSAPTNVVQPVVTPDSGASSTGVPPASAATTTQSAAGPSSALAVPTTVNAAPTAPPPAAVPVPVRPAVPVAGCPAFITAARPVVWPPTIPVAWRPAVPPAAPGTAATHPASFPRPPFFAVPPVPAPTAAYTAAFRAAAAKPTPPPAPQP